MNTTDEILDNLEKITNNCIKKNITIINKLNKQNEKIKSINYNKNSIDNNISNININKFKKCIIM